jgi:hypothetical protein
MSTPFWMRPMQYNDDPVEKAEDSDTAEFPSLRMESKQGDRSSQKPDPRLADDTPMDYSRGPHSRPLDIDDSDEPAGEA